jgi:hypothetical protein
MMQPAACILYFLSAWLSVHSLVDLCGCGAALCCLTHPLMASVLVSVVFGGRGHQCHQCHQLTPRTCTMQSTADTGPCSASINSSHDVKMQTMLSVNLHRMRVDVRQVVERIH